MFLIILTMLILYIAEGADTNAKAFVKDPSGALCYLLLHFPLMTASSSLFPVRFPCNTYVMILVSTI